MEERGLLLMDHCLMCHCSVIRLFTHVWRASISHDSWLLPIPASLSLTWLLLLLFLRLPPQLKSCSSTPLCPTFLCLCSLSPGRDWASAASMRTSDSVLFAFYLPHCCRGGLSVWDWRMGKWEGLINLNACDPLSFLLSAPWFNRTCLLSKRPRGRSWQLIHQHL